MYKCIYNAKLRCVQKRGTMGPLFDTFLQKIWHCTLNPKARHHDMNIAMDVPHDQHPEFWWLSFRSLGIKASDILVASVFLA